MLYEFINANRAWLLERSRQFREARTNAGTDQRTDEGIVPLPRLGFTVNDVVHSYGDIRRCASKSGNTAC